MRTKGKEIRVVVSIQTYGVLKAFAKDLGVPVAYIVRCATKNYLSKKGAYVKYGIN